MKSKIVIIALSLLLVGVLFVEHREKSAYQRHLSHHLSNDFSGMYQNLLNNREIYEGVLAEKTLTIEEAQVIRNAYFDYLKLLDYYGQLGRELGSLKDETTAVTSENVSLIESLFTRWIQNASEYGTSEYEKLDLFEEVEKEQKIDETFAENLKMINELNEEWISTFSAFLEVKEKNGEVDFMEFHDNNKKDGVSQKFWVELLEELDITTENFMNEKGYHSMILPIR